MCFGSKYRIGRPPSDVRLEMPGIPAYLFIARDAYSRRMSTLEAYQEKVNAQLI
jgi:hypothetical protein